MARRFDDIIYLKLSFAITSLHCLTAAQKKHFFCRKHVIGWFCKPWKQDFRHILTLRRNTPVVSYLYMFSREVNPMYSVLFHLITEQLLSRSVLHLESWYIWLDRRGTGGWGLDGEVRSSNNPPWGSALQLPQLEKGLDRLISGTVQLSQLGTQLLFLISVKIRCTPQMKQESLLNEKMYGWPRAGSAASNLSCFVDVNPICSARGASRFTGGVTNWYIAPLPGTFSLFERFIQISVILILLNYKHNLQ